MNYEDQRQTPEEHAYPDIQLGQCRRCEGSTADTQPNKICKAIASLEKCLA